MERSAASRSAPEVVCIGEALALVPALPDPGAPVPDAASLAGAEANVAVGLVGAGVAAAWVGRLGADALGSFLRMELEHRGVDVAAVEIDPDRPTGYYAKTVTDPATTRPPRTPCGAAAPRRINEAADPPVLGSRMQYRRAGSAASAMGPAFLDAPAVRARLDAARVVHTSGITAALSDSCAALMHELTGRPRATSARAS
jgi:2-dehydro-3-deoxygluconokinase